MKYIKFLPAILILILAVSLVACSVSSDGGHEHTFDQEKVSAEFLKEEATCLSGAVYFKSCTCGEKGTETFTSGDPVAHTFDREVANETTLKSAATCTDAAVYYKTCVCGEKGTETFTSGDPVDHTFDQEVAEDAFLATEATCENKATYYTSCVCGEVGTETFESGAVDPDNHTGTSTTLTPGTNGTHTETYDCCGGDAGSAVTCTASNADGDCTTAETCACGNTVTAAQSHTLVIKANKNDTHHTMECTNANCNHEEDAAHAFDQTVAETGFLKAAATCQAKAVYYKSCACGKAGTETFEHGEKDAANHTGTASYANHNNGTHTATYDCCSAAAGAPVPCTASNADGDCTTAETCACGYTVTAAQTHTLAIKADNTDTHHTMECTNASCDHEEEATHTLIDTVHEDFLKSPATCTDLAVYYKSCACGHESTETFTTGTVNASAHTEATATELVDNNDGTHDVVWECCAAVENDNVTCTATNDNNCTTDDKCVCGHIVYAKTGDTHTPAVDPDGAKDATNHTMKCSNTDCHYTENAAHTLAEVVDDDCLKSAATCSAKAVYYKSCTCGHISDTETFTSGNPAPHSFTDGICSVCGELKPTDGLTFVLNSTEDGYILTDAGTAVGLDKIIIPAIYNDKPVVAIDANAFKDYTTLKTITIPESISSIGANAFDGCTALQTVRYIGTEAEWLEVTKDATWDGGNAPLVLCTPPGEPAMPTPPADTIPTLPEDNFN